MSSFAVSFPNRQIVVFTCVKEHDACYIIKYHCPQCQLIFGPSIWKRRTNWHWHDYSDPDASYKPVQTGTYVFIKELKSHSESAESILTRLNGDQFNLQYLLHSGFTNPVLVSKKDGLGLVMPPEDLTVSDVMDFIGPDFMLDVIGVRKQEDLKMTMLSDFVKPPLHMYSNIGVFQHPAVMKYCLMSTENSFTNFHIDFGGSSVWYLRSPEGRSLYEHWMASANWSEAFFADQADVCYWLTLTSGQTLFIPTGWIHSDMAKVVRTAEKLNGKVKAEKETNKGKQGAAKDAKAVVVAAAAVQENVTPVRVDGASPVKQEKPGPAPLPVNLLHKESVYDFNDSDDDGLVRAVAVLATPALPPIFAFSNNASMGNFAVSKDSKQGSLKLRLSFIGKPKAEKGPTANNKPASAPVVPQTAASKEDSADDAIQGMLSMSKSAFTFGPCDRGGPMGPTAQELLEGGPPSTGLALELAGPRGMIGRTRSLKRPTPGGGRAKGMRSGEEEDLGVSPHEECHADDDYLDEAWNPKAKLAPNCPKPPRPTREGTQKKSVNHTIEDTASKLANKAPPKRSYHCKKAIKPSLPPDAFRLKKPKKGFTIAKQRLGKILKVHKIY
ncbi:hypothetical protein HPB49_020118 [Dermacentor silvarum]|uniref:Uncharacterized protein n=1 Tax=Dermacentor silvarum TaxID=543639 RepID=A0ACB8CH89_DERSI|nr:hypothetical protein HPB49_020118 [Dermacentor silvarum]